MRRATVVYARSNRRETGVRRGVTACESPGAIRSREQRAWVVCVCVCVHVPRPQLGPRGGRFLAGSLLPWSPVTRGN